MPAFLELMLAGQSVGGDATQAGREGDIEVLYYRQMAGVTAPGQAGSQRGQRTFEPIVFRKRIDKASPLIQKALANNEAADGTIRFFRTEATTGTAEQFYTVEFSGRVTTVEQYLPEVFMTGGEAAVQPLEQISISYDQLTFTFEDGEISFMLTI
jgi:type VI secretion system secreted protein Hcp